MILKLRESRAKGESVKKRKALSWRNRPRSFGASFYVLIWLLLDRLQPAGWVWGVVGTICALHLIGNLVDFFNTEDVELP